MWIVNYTAVCIVEIREELEQQTSGTLSCMNKLNLHFPKHRQTCGIDDIDKRLKANHELNLPCEGFWLLLEHKFVSEQNYSSLPLQSVFSPPPWSTFENHEYRKTLTKTLTKESVWKAPSQASLPLYGLSQIHKEGQIFLETSISEFHNPQKNSPKS